ncbi:MAG: ribosome small subunit-dependent GTPase A [Desulfobacteraceae bacterium 4572_35.1]|nr:MAG: ribosome small subunit-dependent GTPase A [Desulfobacteraceae bacterium 4572_35.1]
MARIKIKSKQAPLSGKEGLIVSHFGVAVLVRFADGSEERVKVKRNSGHVVGDLVLIVGERLQRLSRRNVLRRRDPFAKERIIAANLDVLAIVVAPRPQTPAGFLERAVVAARAAGIEPCLVVNKSDLAAVEVLRHQLGDDFPAVARMFAVSAHTGAGLDQLRKFIASSGRIAFVGVSGAGKSSIMNALHPQAKLETGGLNDADHGCHTTSFSTLVTLASGGEVVDTPGFRDLAPVDVSCEDLAHWYPGLMSIIEQHPCRFRNCSHRQEPGCSVKKAVTDGRLSQQRYDLYLHTLDELEALESRC